MTILYIHTDGGRAAAGLGPSKRDCVARAVALATGLPYAEVHATLAAGNAGQRRSKHQPTKRAATADAGINTTRKWFKDYMTSLGWEWVPTMVVGTGCRVHLRADELPAGRLIVSVSRHLTCVIDGVVHDTHDPSRGGSRCVYGYWQRRA
jgi:hypothetical protein